MGCSQIDSRSQMRRLLSDDDFVQDLLRQAARSVCRRRHFIFIEVHARAEGVAMMGMAAVPVAGCYLRVLRAPLLPLGPLLEDSARLVALLVLAAFSVAGHVLRHQLELLHGRGHRTGAAHVAFHLFEGALDLLGLARLVASLLRIERRALFLEDSPLPLRAGAVASAVVAAAVVAAVYLLLRGHRLRGRQQEVHRVVGHITDQAPWLREQQLLGVGVERARRVVATLLVAVDHLPQFAACRMLLAEGARAGLVAGPVHAARFVAEHGLAELQQLLD
mmetsp:Transcript_129619/g.252404  ORF Transcript_129619/g.252404 Transcript_129619/m.252404 type:complete len:277 (+) Transcript_129619:340-1170(+)